MLDIVIWFRTLIASVSVNLILVICIEATDQTKQLSSTKLSPAIVVLSTAAVVATEYYFLCYPDGI